MTSRESFRDSDPGADRSDKPAPVSLAGNVRDVIVAGAIDDQQLRGVARRGEHLASHANGDVEVPIPVRHEHRTLELRDELPRIVVHA